MEENIKSKTEDNNRRIIDLWRTYESVFFEFNQNIEPNFKKRFKQKDNELEIDYNQRIQNKIDEIFIDDLRIPTLLFDLPTKCEVLFIGLNPSFSTDNLITLLSKIRKVDNLKVHGKSKYINKISIDKGLSETGLTNYFSYNTDLSYDDLKRRITEFEKISHQDYPYFKKFKELAYSILKDNLKQEINEEELSEYWGHIDWFYFRETTAKKVDYYLKGMPCFFWKQIAITKTIIELLEPKLILVANASASKLFKNEYLIKKARIPKTIKKQELPELYDHVIANVERYGIAERRIDRKKCVVKLTYDEHESVWLNIVEINEFDPSIGSYRFQINNNDATERRVFFSGMINGQRALDLDSFMRLEWHLKNNQKINIKTNNSNKIPLL